MDKSNIEVQEKFQLANLDEKSSSDDSTGSTKEADENTNRGNWTNPVEFLLSCIAYAVGFGNIWRFPYLCMRNGGGAFLVPYFTFLFLCGLPLFYLEVSVGQFTSLSPISIWKVCPLFKGLGWGMVIVSAIVAVYYNVIICWVLYYLVMSFARVLPWAECGHEWNTQRCLYRLAGNTNGTTYNVTSDNITLEAGNVTNITLETRSPAEEFWEFRVLRRSSGIHNVEGIHWELFLSLVLSWILVGACLIKGIKSSGKVVYVTATLPYVLLFSLMIRGATLPGSADGIMYYLTPDIHRLMKFQTWAEACLQIFYSLGPAWGGLITMASYNRFHHNCVRDALILPLVNCGTSFFAGFVIFSIIGFMAKDAGLPVSEVIKSGPGLVFVAYPEAISRMPVSQLWSVMFFLMLFNVGLGTQFGMVHTVLTGIQDRYPKIKKKWKPLLTAGVCLLYLILGVPMVTKAGLYVFQIVDWYSSTFSLTLIAFLECLVFAWIYGWRRLRCDIELMHGYPPRLIWKILWCFVTPILLLCVLSFSCMQMSVPTYGDYTYPRWAIGMGWALSMVSLVPIPVYAVIQLAHEQGTLWQRFRKSLRPASDWGPALDEHRSELPCKL